MAGFSSYTTIEMATSKESSSQIKKNGKKDTFPKFNYDMFNIHFYLIQFKIPLYEPLLGKNYLYPSTATS